VASVRAPSKPPLHLRVALRSVEFCDATEPNLPGCDGYFNVLTGERPSKRLADGAKTYDRIAHETFRADV
jgi:hypothetical protein